MQILVVGVANQRVRFIWSLFLLVGWQLQAVLSALKLLDLQRHSQWPAVVALQLLALVDAQVDRLKSQGRCVEAVWLARVAVVRWALYTFFCCKTRMFSSGPFLGLTAAGYYIAPAAP